MPDISVGTGIDNVPTGEDDGVMSNSPARRAIKINRPAAPAGMVYAMTALGWVLMSEQDAHGRRTLR